MTRRRSSRVCIRTSQSLQRSVLFATSHRRVPALSAVSTPARVIKESIKSIKSFHPYLRRGQSPHALATGLAGCTHFALAMSHTRASHAAWTRPPSVFSSSSRVIADSTHGRGTVARVTAEAPRAPFARARTASVVVVVIVVIVTVIVIVIARGSDGRCSPQGP